MKEALYYKKEASGRVRCRLCPHGCLIAEGKRGLCWGRVNRGGMLFSEIYGKTTSIALDPIEKKPLYHYHPGEKILSLGTNGCNFFCPWCQNWMISQDRGQEAADITVGQVIGRAKNLGSFGIAYTYNEPFIWFEFVLDCCKAARQEGLENVFVTNGYVNAEPLREILPFIGAANIDIKSIEEEFYRDRCRGRLEPVLATSRIIKERAHVEITNLIIPTLNDAPELIKKLADWVADNLGADTPLHFSRYFPCYKTDIEPTPRAALERAKEIAEKRLKYVYLGNV